MEFYQMKSINAHKYEEGRVVWDKEKEKEKKKEKRRGEREQETHWQSGKYAEATRGKRREVGARAPIGGPASLAPTTFGSLSLPTAAGVCQCVSCVLYVATSVWYVGR